MAIFRLLRATADNGMFTRLRAEWDGELATIEEGPPPDLYSTMMTHAAKIIEERSKDPKYGIFAVARCEDDDKADGRPYEAFLHISHKLPNTSDATLRVLWNLFAPRYQTASAADIARLMTAIVMGRSIYLAPTCLRGRSKCISETPSIGNSRRSLPRFWKPETPKYHLRYAAIGCIFRLLEMPPGEITMEMKGLESNLYAAFLHAAAQMGARVSGMSCFVRNWGAVKPLADAVAPKSDTIHVPRAA